MALAIYHIVKGGGLGQGGFNFDAKLRRQSIDPDDMVLAHAEAMDLCARALLVAEKMIVDDKLGAAVKARYAGWQGALGQDIIEGRMELSDFAALVARTGLDPQPCSGGQERLEALVNRYI
jgi:xylose isomerase